MKQVYIAADMMDAELFKDHLISLRIPAIVKGAMLTGIIGEIPTNSFPTVWVEDERDFDLARKAVNDYEKKAASNIVGEEWVCSQCGENLGPQFLQCWSCGEMKQEEK